MKEDRINDEINDKASADVRCAFAVRTCSPSAVVAEYLWAVTLHCWAAEGSLHPILTLRALLELCSSHEADKASLLLVEVHQLSIFTASHVVMRGAFAVEAIFFLTWEALELVNAAIILEDNWTVWGGAPAGPLPILLDVLGKDEIEVLLLQHWGEDGAEYLPLDSEVAVLFRALYLLLAILDFY